MESEQTVPGIPNEQITPLDNPGVNPAAPQPEAPEEETLETLETPTQATSSTTSTAQSDDKEEAKPPLYESPNTTPPTPTPTQTAAKSLYSNGGKYSFIGQASQRKLALIFTGVLAVLLLIAGGATYLQSRNAPAETPSLSEQELATIPSSDLLTVDGSGLESAGNILINGPLEVKNQFVLSPSLRPESAQSGQIYFDSEQRTFVYFDGQDYKTITTADQIARAQGALSGELETSLTEQNEYIENVVRSLQSSTGAVSLNAGAGIGIDGLQISNAGVTRIQGTPNQVLVSANTGSVQVSLPQNIHTGASPTFNGMSLSSLNVSGQSTLNVIQADQLTLGQALGISSGGIGSDGSDFATHGILYYDGTKLASTPTASAPNLCLVSTVGAPAFAACDSAMGDAVNSLNGLQGNLTLANASGSGSTITIDTASQLQPGILSTVAQRIGGLKTFTGGISFTFGSGITSENNLSIQPAQHRDLILGTSGTGRLVMSALNCSAQANGGKLTVDADGVVMCAEDTGGDGVGLGSISAADSSITVDNTDGNNPQVSVNTRTNGGLSTTAGGLGLVDTCGDDQVLKYSTATGWVCANDEGTNDGGGCPTCVALQSTTPGTAQNGHINVTGSILGGSASFAGPVAIQPPTEATDAFQLQNAAGASLVTGNTQNMNVTIGSLAAPTTSEISGQLPSGATTYASLGSQYPTGIAVTEDKYAYAITTSSWLYVLDVSNPNVSPTIAFSQNMGTGTITDPLDVVINGDYMYILDEPNTSMGYIRVFDISNRTNPTLLTSITTGRYPAGMAMNGNNLYVINNETGSFGNDHIYVYSLTDPAAPVESGQQIIGSISTWPTSVAVDGTNLFVTDRGLNQVMAFDVSDPSNITELGTVNTDTAPVDISIHGDHAYVVNNSSATMQSFDISNPASMQWLHTTDPGEVYPLPTAVHAAAGYAMLVTYYNGGSNAHGYLQLYNTSNPASPTLVGSTALLARGQGMTMHDGVAYVSGNYPLGNNIQTFKLGDGAITLRVYGSSSMTGSLDIEGDFSGNNATLTGTVTASNLQSLGYVRAQNFDTNTLSSTLNIGTTYANAINLNQNTTVGLGKSLTVQGATSVRTDSAAALRVADSSDDTYFLVDTSGKNVDIGSTSAPTENTDVGGSLPSGAAGNVNISSLPNRVAISGDYAYVASSIINNLQIVNISNPASPTAVGSIATSAAAQDVAVEGTRAYVAVGTNTVQVFDVSNPASPALIGSTTTRNASTSIQSIKVKDNYLYIAHIGIATSYYGYMDTFDMTNPAVPVAQGSSPKTLGSSTEEIRMDIEGDRLYVISKGLTTNSGFRIINISNPAASSLPMTNHNMLSTNPGGGVAVHGGYAYIPFNNSSLLQVYNVSAIGGSGTLTPVGSTPVGNGAAATAVSDSGKFLYVVDENTNVLQVYNISDPLSPQAVGTVDTSSGSGTAKTVAVAASPDGTVAVVNNTRSNLVTVDLAGSTPRISLNQNTVLSTGRTFTAQGITTIATDSETAFQVQDASGGSVLTVDTENSLVITSGAFAVNGNSGISTSCDVDESLNNIVVTGGIITGGTCGDGSGEGGGTTGAIQAPDGVLTPSLDTIDVGGTLAIGTTNAASINLNQNTTIAAGKTLNVLGDATFASTSETALSVTDADEKQFLLIDTVNGQVSIGAPVPAPEDEGGGGGSDLAMPDAYTSRTTMANQPYDVVVEGNYAYVSQDFADNVAVYDVSNPASPSLVTNISMDNPGRMTADGNYLYVLGDYVVYVVDISTPASASLVFTSTVFSSYGTFEAITKSGNYLYIPTGNRALMVYNATNPLATGLYGARSNAFNTPASAYAIASNPASPGYSYLIDGAADLIRTYLGPGGPNPQASPPTTGDKPTNISVHGNYAYVTSSPVNADPGGFEVFDISNPATPVKRGSVDTENWPMDVSASDNGEFVGVINYNSNSFQAIDTSDPDNPINIGSVSVGTAPLALDTQGEYAYVVTMSNRYLEIYQIGEAGPAPEVDPTFGVTLNSNTVMTSGNVMQLQGETSVKTDSEKAFRVQTAAGDTLLTADTVNGTLSVNGSVTIQVDSATALDIQDADGNSFLTVDTATDTLTVAGDGIFAGNLTVNGHVITGGDAPATAVQAAAGTGATCNISGNDTSGTITIVAGSAPLSEGDACIATFSEAFTSAPRPVISPRDKASSEVGAYAAATTTTLTLSLSVAPVDGQTYEFNYWNPQ